MNVVALVWLRSWSFSSTCWMWVLMVVLFIISCLAILWLRRFWLIRSSTLCLCIDSLSWGCGASDDSTVLLLRIVLISLVGGMFLSRYFVAFTCSVVCRSSLFLDMVRMSICAFGMWVRIVAHVLMLSMFGILRSSSMTLGVSCIVSSIVLWLLLVSLMILSCLFAVSSVVVFFCIRWWLLVINTCFMVFVVLL